MRPQIGLTQTLQDRRQLLARVEQRPPATSTQPLHELRSAAQLERAFNITQPLLRNYKIDNLRQTLETSRKDREAADIQLQSTIVSTTRNVKNAYWDLAYNIDNLKAQQQSLDLAKRLLADNEKRVQIGTMAPIDIVEAQSEVARNDETVIVAEAAIKQAEDRLRALIFDPTMPDFWTVSLEPSDSMPFHRAGGRRRRARCDARSPTAPMCSCRRTRWRATTSTSGTSATRSCRTSTRRRRIGATPSVACC